MINETLLETAQRLVKTGYVNIEDGGYLDYPLPYGSVQKLEELQAKPLLTRREAAALAVLDGSITLD